MRKRTHSGVRGSVTSSSESLVPGIKWHASHFPPNDPLTFSRSLTKLSGILLSNLQFQSRFFKLRRIFDRRSVLVYRVTENRGIEFVFLDLATGKLCFRYKEILY